MAPDDSPSWPIHPAGLASDDLVQHLAKMQQVVEHLRSTSPEALAGAVFDVVSTDFVPLEVRLAIFSKLWAEISVVRRSELRSLLAGRTWLAIEIDHGGKLSQFDELNSGCIWMCELVEEDVTWIAFELPDS